MWPSGEKRATAIQRNVSARLEKNMITWLRERRILSHDRRTVGQERTSLRALISYLLNNLSRMSNADGDYWQWQSLRASPTWRGTRIWHRKKLLWCLERNEEKQIWKLLENSHCHWRSMTQIWPAIWELPNISVWEPTSIVNHRMCDVRNMRKKNGDWFEDKHQQAKTDFAELCASTYVEEIEYCNRCNT